jgi:hypothetical protein
MATFSKRQQQPPNPARDVAVVAAAVADAAGEAEAAVREALDGLATIAGAPADRLVGFLQSAVYACPASEDAAVVHAALGLAPLPAVATTDSAVALWQASLAVASGHADAVLVAGWDDAGAVCAVLADRETAETLTTGPRAFAAVTAMAAAGDPGSAVQSAADRARALAGVTADAPSVDADALDALRWLAGQGNEPGHTATVFVSGAQVTAVVLQAS